MWLAMEYDRELTFYLNILKKLNVKYHILSDLSSHDESLDLGIRHFLNRPEEYFYTFKELPMKSQPNTIYKLTDQYLCNYIYFLLPDQASTFVFIGPYLKTQITHNHLLQELERLRIPPHLYSQMEDYYGMIPVFQDDRVFMFSLNAIAEILWPGSDSFTLKVLQDDTVFTNPADVEENSPTVQDTLISMEYLEQRYQVENQLLRAVSLGQTHKALQMLTSFSELALKKRVSDPLRNAKNYCIIINTLLRKAAENGAVHPLYLDKVSSDFAKKIELLTDISSVIPLMTDFITAYCRLVKKHSYDKYSRTVQKILVSVDADLTGDLSLHSLAQLHAMSPGYLSTLFKKEIGKTLTDYVNERRMKHGAQLLTTTNLQVQTIAQYCGMSDVNYFSKTFKRYYEHTPSEYRKLNHVSAIK
jgi:AraC-like DNA-binding protein